VDCAVTLTGAQHHASVEGCNMRNCSVQGVTIVDGAVYKEVVVIGTYEPQNIVKKLLD
jgi:hypothetical protein